MSDMAAFGGAAPARRSGPWLALRGGLSLAVIAAGVVVAVTRGDTPVANAATILRDPREVTVTVSGVSHPGVDGEAIAAGATVMTGSHGFADLDTRGRHVLLAGSAALAVVDGEHQQLKTGSAVVDARNGAGLLLDLAGATVSIAKGSATEASRGVSVRVGSLLGPALITSTTGRRLTVPELWQTIFSGDALSAATPLHLTDSDNEVQVIPHVVADDLVLKTLARGIDTTGNSTAQIIQSSWTGVAQPVPDAHSRSEQALPVLIADATQGASLQQRYDDAVTWRAQGGSWGVVLHLLDGKASSVESTLAALQKASQPVGQVGTVVTSPVSAARPTSPPTYPIGPIIGGSTPPTSPPGVRPVGPPPPQPPNLLGGVVATLQSVIDGVLKLLPHGPVPAARPVVATPSPHSAVPAAATRTPADQPASQPRIVKPLTSPTPAATGGLLGNLLGGLLGKK